MNRTVKKTLKVLDLSFADLGMECIMKFDDRETPLRLYLKTGLYRHKQIGKFRYIKEVLDFMGKYIESGEWKNAM